MHLIVANMVLDSLYVTPGGDNMKDISVDAKWVASIGAKALGVVATGKDLAKREEARKLLNSPPFREYRTVSWTSEGSGAGKSRAAGGSPLDYR